MPISNKRRDMGEAAWAEYQKERKRLKSKAYDRSESGRHKATKVIVSRRRKKKLLVEYKGGKCQKCGFNEPIYDCYDFHHLDPSEKEFGIGHSDGKNLSLEALKKEADKCILVCANCHRKIHYEEKIADIKARGKEFNITVDDI